MPSIPKKLLKNPFFSDPAAYPLYAVGISAVGLVVFYLGRLAFSHPDGRFNVTARNTHDPQNHKEGSKYYNHAIRNSMHNRSTEILPFHNKISKFLTGYWGDKSV